MRYTLDTRRADKSAFSKLYELDKVAIRIGFRWLPIIKRWYCEVRDPNDNQLIRPQIVWPAGEILLDSRNPKLPPGRLLWDGPDYYTKNDLGKTLNLLYFSVT